jgi:hypothetical protein
MCMCVRVTVMMRRYIDESPGDEFVVRRFDITHAVDTQAEPRRCVSACEIAFACVVCRVITSARAQHHAADVLWLA